MGQHHAGNKSRGKNLWDADSSSSEDSASALAGKLNSSRRHSSAGSSLTMCECGEADAGQMVQCMDCRKRWHPACCNCDGSGLCSTAFLWVTITISAQFIGMQRMSRLLEMLMATWCQDYIDGI